MNRRISESHPLYLLINDWISDEVARHIDSQGRPQVESYLTHLMADSMDLEQALPLRDADGRPLLSIIEMIAEADIRLNARSFEEEREMRRRIGDYILFWSGVFPEHLKGDYRMQGRESYFIVSSFNQPPHDEEAPIFRDLSEGFDEFAFVMGQVGRRMRGTTH